MKVKFPKIFHLPWSLSVTSDDKMLQSTNIFIGKEIVVSHKLDGECTGMTSKVCHARSLDSRDHPSRHWVKQLHSQIKNDIPKGWKFYGENVFARHSIFYQNLPTYFFLFAILNDNNYFLSWDDTKEWASLLGLHTVPELYRGLWDEEKIKNIWTGVSPFGGEDEGYVVRITNTFDCAIFSNCIAKNVRANHVQTSSHWMSEKVVPNQLKSTLQSGI